MAAPYRAGVVALVTFGHVVVSAVPQASPRRDAALRPSLEDRVADSKRFARQCVDGQGLGIDRWRVTAALDGQRRRHCCAATRVSAA
jgi:hypothetical protein